MVVQHDRMFMREVPLVSVLAAMERDPGLRYVGLHTGSTLGYEAKAAARFRLRIEPREGAHDGLRLLPLLQWIDSTHIASADYYRRFVFSTSPRRTKGNFIEADLGQQQAQDIREGGLAAHAPYGTWLLDDGVTGAVAHCDGRNFRDEHWARAN